MRRAAVIDVGTNSAKMSIAAFDSGISIVAEVSEVTRLGKGVDESGMLRRDAIERTLLAIEGFVERARREGVTRIVAIGTSALRDAANGAAFVEGLAERTGLEIEIISGDREAQLAYRAIASDRSLAPGTDDRLAVFDVGGGSTELTIGLGPSVESHVSLNIGAVRLTERVLHGDPPTVAEVEQAREVADAALLPVVVPTTRTRIRTVGIGGTLVNIAAMTAPDAGSVHGVELQSEQIASVVRRLSGMTTVQRRDVPGLEAARADVIVGGILVVQALMRRLGVSAVGVSVRGLRYGVLAELASEI